MSNDEEWTGSWVAKKIRSHPPVAKVLLVGPQRLELTRTDLPALVVGTTSVACLDADTLRVLLVDAPVPSFIVNVPKESYTTGDALVLARTRSVALGGLGDLTRAVRMRDVADYVSPEVAFVERGLEQHKRVESFQRVDDRRYIIDRRGIPSLTVVFLKEYELTADHVRTAFSRYQSFDAVVITNPNGNATSSAQSAASSMGVSIYKWGTFLGALNKT
jgi:hypothetical protein